MFITVLFETEDDRKKRKGQKKSAGLKSEDSPNKIWYS